MGVVLQARVANAPYRYDRTTEIESVRTASKIRI